MLFDRLCGDKLDEIQLRRAAVLPPRIPRQSLMSEVDPVNKVFCSRILLHLPAAETGSQVITKRHCAARISGETAWQSVWTSTQGLPWARTARSSGAPHL